MITFIWLPGKKMRGCQGWEVGRRYDYKRAVQMRYLGWYNRPVALLWSWLHKYIQLLKLVELYTKNSKKKELYTKKVKFSECYFKI